MRSCESTLQAFVATQLEKYHVAVVEKAEDFKTVIERKQVSLVQQFSSILAQCITKIIEKLKSIAETIILYGRQRITLRIHCDDSKHLEQSPFANHGNFVALLNFRVQSGDKLDSN